MRQEVCKQEMFQAPCSHPSSSNNPLLLKVQQIFQKWPNTQKIICPKTFHHICFCQIMYKMGRNIFLLRDQTYRIGVKVELLWVLRKSYYEPCWTCIEFSSRHSFESNLNMGEWNISSNFYQHFHTCVREDTVALVPCNIINAGPLVQAWVGGTFIDIGLAIWACRTQIKHTWVPDWCTWLTQLITVRN